MDTRTRSSDFDVLISHLISDAFHILPEKLREVVMAGDPSKFNPSLMSDTGRLKELQRLLDLAHGIGAKLYGENPGRVHIPQTIYFERMQGSFSLEERFLSAACELASSSDLGSDKYNLAVNLLVNGLLSGISPLAAQHSSVPKEGVYLRDSDGTLHLHEEP